MRHVTQFTEVGWKYLLNGSGSGELPNGGYYATWVDPNSTHFTMNMVKISRAWPLNMWDQEWTSSWLVTRCQESPPFQTFVWNVSRWSCAVHTATTSKLQSQGGPIVTSKVLIPWLSCFLLFFLIAKSIRILSDLFIWNWPGNGNGTLSSIYESTRSAASVAPGLFESTLHFVVELEQFLKFVQPWCSASGTQISRILMVQLQCFRDLQCKWSTISSASLSPLGVCTPSQRWPLVKKVVSMRFPCHHPLFHWATAMTSNRLQNRTMQGGQLQLSDAKEILKKGGYKVRRGA